MKRKEKYERRYSIKKNRFQTYFNLNPIITLNSPFEHIVDQMRRTKKSKEWKDTDKMIRCSHIDIIPRATLKTWLLKYLSGTQISAIAKASSYSYVRIKRGFNAANKILQEAENKLDKLN